MYDTSRRESKDDLRAEIHRLRRCNEENDRLFRAIYTMKDVDAGNAFIQDLVEGTKFHRAILEELDGEIGCRLMCEVGQESTVGSSILEDSICPNCLSRLPSRAMHRSASGSSELGVMAEAPEATLTSALRFPVSLSSRPGDDASHSQPDRWTRAGCTVASVRQLLDALLTCDYLPFCLLCRDPFLRDYHGGLTRYCSSALVNALLALATRVVRESIDEAQGPNPVPGCTSKSFFVEAEALICGAGPSASLPDIQAIGVLALYQITCGLEAEALALAESFAARIAHLCLHGPPVGAEDDEYAKVRATSFCGGVSLIR